jgi:predicted AAA+ superfamily ATPase
LPKINVGIRPIIGISIYDYFDLQVFFSGSSAIRLEHSKADLSRKALLYHFNGLSFREFLELKLDKKFPVYSLEEITFTKDQFNDIKRKKCFIHISRHYNF